MEALQEQWVLFFFLGPPGSKLRFEKRAFLREACGKGSQWQQALQMLDSLPEAPAAATAVVGFENKVDCKKCSFSV